MTNEHPIRSLRNLLIGRKAASGNVPPYRSAKELAQKLAELPSPRYPSPKNTEAFLSRIFRGREHVPSVLQNEIIRQLAHSRKREDSILENELAKSIARHNEALDRGEEWRIGQDQFNQMWAHASLFACSEHLILTSQAAFDHNIDILTVLIEIQLAAMGVVDPHYCPGVLMHITGDLRYEAIWDRDKKDIQFVYLVESSEAAYWLWKKIYTIAIHANTAIIGDGESNLSDLKQTIEKNTISGLREQENILRIFVLTGPWRALCSKTIVALDSSSAQTNLVYSVTNKWVPALSENERRAWRELFFSARADIFRSAIRCAFKDIESAILADPFT